MFFMLTVTVLIEYRFANLDINQFFFTYRKHRFIELVILQIPKNLDLSMSINRKQFVGPSTSNNEKNIWRPPLAVRLSKP
jgi:hypothetical protein